MSILKDNTKKIITTVVSKKVSKKLRIDMEIECFSSTYSSQTYLHNCLATFKTKNSEIPTKFDKLAIIGLA